MSEDARDAAGFTVARGVLRDAIAGIKNLQLLLASRKVAPKAIAQLLGDLAGTCDEIVPAFRNGSITRSALFSEAAKEDSKAALQTLDGFLGEQVSHFQEAIATATSRTMNAASRLALEHAVGSIAEQLSGALPLLEIWADLGTEPFPVDWVELISLSRSGDQPQTLGALPRQLYLNVPGGLTSLQAPPRALLNLLGLAMVCLDVGRKTTIFELCTEADASAPASSFDLRIGAAGGSGPYLILVPPCARPTRSTAHAAARLLGLDLQFDNDRAVFRLEKLSIQ